MQHSIVEFIDAQLVTIKEVLRVDDAYYVNDIIVTNVTDPDLRFLVEELLDRFDYKGEARAIVLEIIDAIQAKIAESEE